MKNFLIVVVCWTLALLIMKFRRPIKEFIGNIGFAEKYLGMGGTNTFIVLLAMLLFIGSLMYATGTLQSLLQGFFGSFFGL
jgi:hypothetical protein